MRTTQQMSITLPNELAAAVREKVASGEYASESEVIRDGLRVLIARDRVVERWLRNKVGPAYDAPRRIPLARSVLTRFGLVWQRNAVDDDRVEIIGIFHSGKRL